VQRQSENLDIVGIAPLNQHASLSHRVFIDFRGNDRDRKRGHSQQERVRIDLFLAAKQESVFPYFREGRLRGDHLIDVRMIEDQPSPSAKHGGK